MAITKERAVQAIANNPEVIYDYVNPLLSQQERAGLVAQLFPPASDATELSELKHIIERLEGLNKGTVGAIIAATEARIAALEG